MIIQMDYFIEDLINKKQFNINYLKKYIKIFFKIYFFLINYL